jgi:TRAP-type uncharacterized transport system fused permease subunit
MTDAARPPSLEPEERRTIPVAVWVSVAITLLAIVLGAFQLYTAGYRPLNLFYQRGFHLLVILLIAFLAFPIGRRKRGPSGGSSTAPSSPGPSTAAATCSSTSTRSSPAPASSSPPTSPPASSWSSSCSRPPGA